MKPSGEPSQDWFLYNGGWNIARDSYLIRRLVEREAECKPTKPADSPHALICAMEALNKEVNADVTYSDVLDRVNFLRKRYKCFKKLTARVETVWDEAKNQVTTDDKVWKKIFEEDDFARAYYKHGDPLWKQLFRLFGYNDIKIEASPTVILISDSPNEFVASATNKCVIISDDEVTSHVIKVPAARKLSFNDDAESSIEPNNMEGKDEGIEMTSCASSSPHN